MKIAATVRPGAVMTAAAVMTILGAMVVTLVTLLSHLLALLRATAMTGQRTTLTIALLLLLLVQRATQTVALILLPLAPGRSVYFPCRVHRIVSVPSLNLEHALVLWLRALE